MRRIIGIGLGVLELAIAALLAGLACRLPATAEVAQSFTRAEVVTYRAGNQVQRFRQQLRTLRQPELFALAQRFQHQTEAITAALRKQSIDYEAVQLVSDALRDVGTGLESMSETLNPAALGQLGTGLGETAKFLEERVVPTAKQAADRLDDLTRSLKEDSQRLSVLVRDFPLDLNAVREVHDSLARFGQGLNRTQTLLDIERMGTMREGFTGLESSLATGAEQVERLAAYTYPMVQFQGGRPQVERRSFWPEGEQIAAGMRKAAAGADAAGKELDELSSNLPQLRQALAESEKMVERTRTALGNALKQRDKIEPLLKDMPAHIARLTECLPSFSADLSQILRDTRHLQEAATALRRTQKGIEHAASRWPDIQKMLTRSALLLQTTREQLDYTLRHRDEYDAGLKQSVALAESFSALLPLFTEQLSSQLEEQEEGLDQLGRGIDEVGASIPLYAHTAADLLFAGRLLLWVVAGLAGVHGLYLLVYSQVQHQLPERLLPRNQ
jgi:DNA repair ATPase RecN